MKKKKINGKTIGIYFRRKMRKKEKIKIYPNIK